ncbi:HMG-box transcription factor [Ceraceosorus bombacis]|uniref:HMG-box transcription factor n=1 Tax=Ceraceosorus bombacis TaxID=401625 RepID=A0A0P1B743_9BASI|nr:HMG-box transcription factor [Ceraceosorus bombacis]
MSAAALDVDCPPPPPAASMSRADGKQLASVLDSVSDSLIDFSGSTTNDTSSVLCPSSVTLELAHLQASSQSFKLFDSTARPLRRSARTRRQASQASTSVEKLSKAGPRKMSNYFSHAASSSTPSGSTPCSAPISIPPAQLDPSSSALHRTPPAVTPTPMPDKGAFELHLESTAFRDALPSQASSSSAASPSRSSSSTTHAADLDHSATRHERWAGHNLNDGGAAGSKVLSRSVSSSDLGEGSSRAAAEDPASLPVSVSIPRSTAPSHARKKAADHVPRPRNAFILFRSHAHRQGLVPKELSANHSNISVIISHMWRSLPTEEREMWAKEAQREKDEHALLYPDYKFKPVYRRENVVRRSVRKEGDEEEKNLKIADHILKSHGRDGVQLGEEPNSNIIASSASERKRVRRAESRAKSRNKIAAAAASASSSLEQAHRNRALKVARRAVREVSKSPATTSSAASPADWHCASQQAWDGTQTQDYVAPALRTVRRSSSVPALADSVNWGKSTCTPAPLSTDGPVIYPASALPQHLKTGFHSYPSPPHQRSATYHEPMHLSAPLHTPMSAYSTVSASGLSSGLAGVQVSRSPQMPISPMTQVHPISASQHSPTFRSQRTDLPRPFTSAGIASAVSNATSALDLSPPTWSNFRDMLASPHVATSYGNARRPSGTGWQSSSRLVNADIGLPMR